MYNFLVTANSNAWDLPAYEYGRDRFGEYTAEEILEKYKALSAPTLKNSNHFRLYLHMMEKLKTFGLDTFVILESAGKPY